MAGLELKFPKILYVNEPLDSKSKTWDAYETWADSEDIVIAVYELKYTAIVKSYTTKKLVNEDGISLLEQEIE